MAKKSRKNIQAEEPQEETVAPVEIQDNPVAEPVQEPIPAPAPVPPPAPVFAPVAKPAPAVKPKPVQAAPLVKKRVRVRKKATKHLSVAVLCTNPVTRRFI